MNALNVIHPYKYEDIWVFDDAKVGLVQEPFVFGADDIIDRYVADFQDPAAGFALLFAKDPFPSYQLKFTWLRSDMSGNWYHDEASGIEGWLCPALLKYFEEPPEEIYAQFREREA